MRDHPALTCSWQIWGWPDLSPIFRVIIPPNHCPSSCQLSHSDNSCSPPQAGQISQFWDMKPDCPLTRLLCAKWILGKTLDPWKDTAVRVLDPRGERSGSQLKERIIHLFGKYLFTELLLTEGFPGGSDSKESACNVGDLGSTPGSGRYLGEGNDYPLQYSSQENSMDKEDCKATAHGVTKGWTWLSN